MDPIKVKRIMFEGYILDFEVEDSCAIKVTLRPSRDPTLIDTSFAKLAAISIVREADVNENTGEVTIMENLPTFCTRAFEEAKFWAEHAITENKAAKALSKALFNSLPVGIEE